MILIIKKILYNKDIYTINKTLKQYSTYNALTIQDNILHIMRLHTMSLIYDEWYTFREIKSAFNVSAPL